MFAVSASGLYRRHGARWALLDVAFDVPQGSVTAITGRNGAGKSTLLRVIATALRPDRGSVLVAGHDICDDRDAARARVTFLGEKLQLYPPLTALENLAVRARFLGASTRRDALLRRLAEVGLEERADDSVATFSAGMQKRLAIAAALQKEAEIVLLDEPYDRLDAPGCGLVNALVSRLRAQGRTVLLATHALHGVGVDQTLVLESGRLGECR